MEEHVKESVTRGEAVYKQICTACHQETGAGIPGTFPPLAKSEWIMGPTENIIRIQLRGLEGPIDVAGVTYPGTIPMAPNAQLSDVQIADVINYIRNSWGNSGRFVKPEEVKALRGEVGKGMLKVSDLKEPVKEEVEEKKEDKKPIEEVSAPQDFKTDVVTNVPAGHTDWGVVGLTISVIAVCSLTTLFGLATRGGK